MAPYRPFGSGSAPISMCRRHAYGTVLTLDKVEIGVTLQAFPTWSARERRTP